MKRLDELQVLLMTSNDRWLLCMYSKDICLGRNCRFWATWAATPTHPYTLEICLLYTIVDFQQHFMSVWRKWKKVNKEMLCYKTRSHGFNTITCLPSSVWYVDRKLAVISTYNTQKCCFFKGYSFHHWAICTSPILETKPPPRWCQTLRPWLGSVSALRQRS